jgi:hypothetical protein
MIKRRKVLRETIDVFTRISTPDYLKHLAMDNQSRWKKERSREASVPKVQVLLGDWGDITLELTKTYGECFAVLNMANAYVPGGGYVEGMGAQEENMYRRTDCHFYITEKEYDRSLNRYKPFMTELISGKNGVVYLDIDNPRICIRGAEDKTHNTLGYAWLKEDEIFPFYELRAAAQDLRGKEKFNVDEARRRIVAQLNTLQANKVRYAVLGAFGCGAFLNPAETIATIYKEEIEKRIDDFSLIVFAILDSGGAYAEFYTVFDTYSPISQITSNSLRLPYGFFNFINLNII